MDVFEITGYRSGVAKDGVNYLEPADSFEEIEDGYIHRQVLQSREGIQPFANAKVDSRIMGIYGFITAAGTRQLLVFSKTKVYLYAGGAWITLTFSAAAQAALGGTSLNITDDSAYISATLYRDTSYAPRLVFCSKGLAGIFFYDGSTIIKLFTDKPTDNPDYTAPATGTLDKAHQVQYFAKRLCLWAPTLGGTEYTQAFVYSARRDVGSGDNFNTPGAGLSELDTNDTFGGSGILGKSMVALMGRSSWIVDSTGDNLNPFVTRKIPGPLGTDAEFSASFWDDSITSLGKSGIISTAGRESKRVDNKIPYFTKRGIDQDLFKLTAGGFDWEVGQFLFSYVESGSEETTQNKVLVRNYEEDSWSTYDLRLTVFGDTQVTTGYVWDDIRAANNPEWVTWDTTTDVWNEVGDPDTSQKFLAGSNNGWVYQLNKGLDDAVRAITGITAANPAVITVGDHDFDVGQQVAIANVVGMTEINNYDPVTPSTIGTLYNITAVTATEITVDVDASQYTAYGSAGIVLVPIRFKAKTVPFNPYRPKGKRCYISYVEFLLDNTGGYMDVTVYSDQEDTPIIQDVRVSSSLSEGQKTQWHAMSINHEADFFTFEFKQFNPGVRFRQTSMRIHAEAGGDSNG